MVPVNVTMNLAAENDTNLLSHASECQKSGALLSALTVKVWAGPVVCSLQGKPVSLPFPVSLREGTLPHGPVVYLQSQGCDDSECELSCGPSDSYPFLFLRTLVIIMSLPG